MHDSTSGPFFNTDADFNANYKINFHCRVVTSPISDSDLDDGIYVLKRSPASLNNKCGGQLTTKHGMPFLCDWPVGELVSYSISELLNLHLVPRTIPAVLSNEKFDKSLSGTETKAAQCTDQQTKLIKMAYVENEAALSFFSAQAVIEDVSDINPKTLNDIGTYIIETGGSPSTKSTLFSRWGDLNKQRVSSIPGTLLSQVIEGFLLDFLVDMCDRYASNIVSFRVGFSNLLPIASGTDPICNPGNFIVSNTDNKLFLIDNGKSLHCRTFLDNSMTNNRQLMKEVMNQAAIDETVKIRQPGDTETTTISHKFNAHKICAFTSSSLNSVYDLVTADYLSNTIGLLPRLESLGFSHTNVNDWINKVKEVYRGKENDQAATSISKLTDFTTLGNVLMGVDHRANLVLEHVIQNCMDCSGLRTYELHIVVAPSNEGEMVKNEVENYVVNDDSLNIIKYTTVLPDKNVIFGEGANSVRAASNINGENEGIFIDEIAVIVLKDTNPVYTPMDSVIQTKTNFFTPTTYQHAKMTALGRHFVSKGSNKVLVSAAGEDTSLILASLADSSDELKSLESSREKINDSHFQDLISVFKFVNNFGNNDASSFGGCLKASITGQPAHGFEGGGGFVDVFVNDFNMFRSVTEGVVEKFDDVTLLKVALTDGSAIRFAVRQLDDGYIPLDWASNAIATGRRDTGEMTDLNAGFIALFIQLSYRSMEAVDEDTATFISNMLDGKQMYVLNSQKTEANKHLDSLQITVRVTKEEVMKVEGKLRVYLKDFMDFNGYIVPPCCKRIAFNWNEGGMDAERSKLEREEAEFMEAFANAGENN